LPKETSELSLNIGGKGSWRRRELDKRIAELEIKLKKPPGARALITS
jgi:hypothetical protein